MAPAEASVTIDVRDMVCAQALAEVDRAVHRLMIGAALEILCNTPDVVRDLRVWLHERKLMVIEETVVAEETRIRIRRI